MSAPVVAVLHLLEHPFSGHAGAVLNGAGVVLEERDIRRGDPLPELAEVDAHALDGWYRDWPYAPLRRQV